MKKAINPPTPREMLHFIKREFGLGEFLPGLRKGSQFQYAGISTYTRHSSFKHLYGEPIILIHSRSARTKDEIELFPDVVFLLLKAYQEGKDKEAIDSPYGRLEDFLQKCGVSTRYPSLYTNESYYAAMVRALAQKLET
jgi:hypothetical protein